MKKKSKGLYFLTLMLALAFTVVACTPKAQQTVTDALTDESGEIVTEEDAMMEDGDSMEHEEDSMMDDGEMMVEDGDSMEDDGDSMSTQAHVFNVGGESFAFSNKEIRVKKGDTVTINFTSNGGLHDWTVDEFNAATSKVNAGGSTSVTFVADKVGTFEYYCSVGNHRQLGMVGNLIVE